MKQLNIQDLDHLLELLQAYQDDLKTLRDAMAMRVFCLALGEIFLAIAVIAMVCK